MQNIIVFRPGPVQGLDSGFWPGRPGQFFFKKNQNDIVLVKKSQRVATGFLTGQPVRLAGSHRVFLSPVFSSIQSSSGLRSAGF